MARRRPVGRRGLPVVTSEGCSYSGTWSWVKLVSVPESPPLGLYDTVPVQLYRQLHVKCCALINFNCPEVVLCPAQTEVILYYVVPFTHLHRLGKLHRYSSPLAYCRRVRCRRATASTSAGGAQRGREVCWQRKRLGVQSESCSSPAATLIITQCS